VVGDRRDDRRPRRGLADAPTAPLARPRVEGRPGHVSSGSRYRDAMPPGAFALVGLFTVSSVVLGVIAWWIARRPPLDGPRGLGGVILPSLAAFGAFYLIGHRAGISIGPELGLFGFQVALFGDVLLAAVAALAAAFGQAAGRRRARARRSGRV
jgi:hypothetical protein